MDDDIHSMNFPAFIIESGSLTFIDVNNARIKQYGYSKEEFLTMKVFALRPYAEQEEVRQIATLFEHENFYAGTSHHCTKNGEQLKVRIIAERTNFKEMNVWLIKEKIL